MILVAGDILNSGSMVAWEALRAGEPALAAIEAGVRVVERNAEDTSVGVGGYPNALGAVELDAGVMDGRTRASGAVGALRGFAHPVSVAYAVMRELPHVLLVGEGAARFAEEIGAERADLFTAHSRESWQAWRQDRGTLPLRRAVWQGHDPQKRGGTTVYLAQDAQGDLAVATSTSGWAWKYPGRLGDTPVAGAGFYADNRYGAAACTGMGELAIRAGLARSVVLYMKMGMSVTEAVSEAIRDLHALPSSQPATLTLYAVDAQGGHDVAGVYHTGEPFYYYFAAGDASSTKRCEVRDLTTL